MGIKLYGPIKLSKVLPVCPQNRDGFFAYHSLFAVCFPITQLCGFYKRVCDLLLAKRVLIGIVWWLAGHVVWRKSFDFLATGPT